MNKLQLINIPEKISVLENKKDELCEKLGKIFFTKTINFFRR